MRVSRKWVVGPPRVPLFTGFVFMVAVMAYFNLACALLANKPNGEYQDVIIVRFRFY